MTDMNIGDLIKYTGWARLSPTDDLFLQNHYLLILGYKYHVKNIHVFSFDLMTTMTLAMTERDGWYSDDLYLVVAAE